MAGRALTVSLHRIIERELKLDQGYINIYQREYCQP